MNNKYLNAILVSLMFSISGLTSIANAGLIDTNAVLLKDADATLLEGWLGQGDLDWHSIWYGETGATATDWHKAADNVGPTFSLFNITLNDFDYLIGGYTDLNWTNGGSKIGNGNSFIFNLSSGVHFEYLGESDDDREITTGPIYFPIWGPGDLYSGRFEIGHRIGGGYSSDSSYTTPNLINGGQLLGIPYDGERWTLNSLETFTVSKASSVPEPSTLAIFALGIMGLASRRFKKKS